ncbi:MAG: ribosome small subunit-dependent GTPase A [Oscillospiraceae bacterium]|nr:ribosome small subunit-dependent GTPase A [Oscillospiraceae bacterium]
MEKTPYIVKGIGGFYYVKTADGIVECRAKGIFRRRGVTPVAGDRVRLEHETGTAVIAEILPRKNVFVRPPVANVDQFFIVASTVQPVPSTLVIDKLSAIAVDRGAQPVLVITKGDLYGADTLAQCYSTAGFPVLCVNAATGEGLAPLRDMLAGKLSVFSGNSGVGKSTLLGALMPGCELETAEISQKLGRGRHTTREVVLYEAHGGLVADTPGFASLDMARAAAIPKENLELAFPDIARLFGQCRFTGCSHLSEVGCAVREAVHRGEIARTRYESYAALYEQAKEQEKR